MAKLIMPDLAELFSASAPTMLVTWSSVPFWMRSSRFLASAVAIDRSAIEVLGLASPRFNSYPQDYVGYQGAVLQKTNPGTAGGADPYSLASCQWSESSGPAFKAIDILVRQWRTGAVDAKIVLLDGATSETDPTQAVR